MSHRLILRYWIPLLGYGLVILYLSSRPASGLPAWEVPDKLLHGMEYMLFGMLLFRLLRRDLGWRQRRLWLGFVITLGLFAFMDERLQSHIPGRDASPWDWFADVGGGLLGAFVYCLIRNTWERKFQAPNAKSQINSKTF